MVFCELLLKVFRVKISNILKILIFDSPIITAMKILERMFQKRIHPSSSCFHSFDSPVFEGSYLPIPYYTIVFEKYNIIVMDD